VLRIGRRFRGPLSRVWRRVDEEQKKKIKMKRVIEWPWRLHRLQGQSRQKSLNRFAASAV
jgi:hypothetical protein